MLPEKLTNGAIFTLIHIIFTSMRYSMRSSNASASPIDWISHFLRRLFHAFLHLLPTCFPHSFPHWWWAPHMLHGEIRSHQGILHLWTTKAPNRSILTIWNPLLFPSSHSGGQVPLPLKANPTPPPHPLPPALCFIPFPSISLSLSFVLVHFPQQTNMLQYLPS